MNHYFLGVDGGGTKTKFLLSDQDGNILSSDIQPTCHYMQCGLDGVTKVLETGLTNCIQKAAISLNQIAHAFVACAGYGDIPEDNKKIYNAAKAALKDIPFDIGNDTDNAIAGSLVGKDGIHVISGTGSIGILKHHNELIRCGGWHHIYGGDEGSAYWIACKLIQEFTKQSDGRHKKDVLYSYTKDVLNLNNDSDILQKTVVEWDFDRTKVASLSPIVYELAKRNTPSALQIYQQAANELAEIYVTLKEKSNEEEIIASYSGGVFKSEQFILDPLKTMLNEHHITLLDPQFEPDIGGLILAFEGYVTITDNVIQNLRKSSVSMN